MVIYCIIDSVCWHQEIIHNMIISMRFSCIRHCRCCSKWFPKINCFTISNFLRHVSPLKFVFPDWLIIAMSSRCPSCPKNLPAIVLACCERKELSAQTLEKPSEREMVYEAPQRRQCKEALEVMDTDKLSRINTEEQFAVDAKALHWSLATSLAARINATLRSH